MPVPRAGLEQHYAVPPKKYFQHHGETSRFWFHIALAQKAAHQYGLQPAIWKVFSGETFVPNRGGLMGYLEQQAAKMVTFLSNRRELGGYIATWAIKKQAVPD